MEIYWSDTTDSNLNNHTLVGATEVFTIGSRKNIPNVPTSAIKVSTNKLCSDDRKGLVSCSKSDSLEPRYTDNGLATSGEVNLRTWYKATTPKSVNGVVDDPCTSLSNTGSVVNWWADFGNLRCERTITTYTPKVDSTIYTNKVNSDLFTNKLSSTTTTGGVNIYADKVSTTVYANKYFSANSCKVEILNAGLLNFSGVGKILTLSPNTAWSNWIDATFSSVYEFTFDQYCVGTYFKVVNGRTNNKGGSIISLSQGSSLYFNVLGVSATFHNISTPNCPSGYTDNGTNCKKTTLACPDASWSDNGANCTKVTPIVSVTSYYCPATYSDMGTYCKKTIQICPDPSWTPATATTCSKVVQVCPDASWTDNVTNCKKNVPEYKLFSTF